MIVNKLSKYEKQKFYDAPTMQTYLPQIRITGIKIVKQLTCSSNDYFISKIGKDLI